MKVDKDGYSIGPGRKPFMVITISLDKINDESIYVDEKSGERYISINVNQSQKKKGAVYLTQTLKPEVIAKSKVLPKNVIGSGKKHISMDYWIKEMCGGDYLEYLFNQPDPDA